MIQKSKRFEWPRKMFDKDRIESENKIVKKYGLKNKREIWKTESKVKYFRGRAKALINSSNDEQGLFFNKLNKIGLNVNSIADVLALGIEDLLKRRLASVVFQKKLASTPKQARQMIVHKKIIIGERMVNSPSYLVRINEEKLIGIKKKIKKPKIDEKKIAEDVKVDEEKVSEDVENNVEENSNE